MNQPDLLQMLAGIQNVDLATFRWCQSRRRLAVLARVARLISRSADGWLYLLLPLLYVAWQGSAALDIVALAAIAYACERACYFVLKNTCRRRRPAELLPDFHSFVMASDRFSFPSGHTSGAFMFAALCTHEFGSIAALILYPWAMLVGASRVVLGVHFPSDIVAGAMLGSSLFFFALGNISA
jgi:undecaprenyl-diphosphatase